MPAAPRRLLLEGAERVDVAVRFEHRRDRVHAERADQLVLEVIDTDMEAELRHARTREARPEAGALEPAQEHVLLARVAETGHAQVAEPPHETPKRLRTADRHDRHPLAFEIAASPLCQRLE